VPLLEQVLKKNPETVKILHKNLPLNFHKMAFPAAIAAHAAGNQGKFWEYHDGLYAEKKIKKSSINQIASKLGLDMEQFEKDLKLPSIQQLIKKDIAEARKLGITGTPTVYINGRKLKQRSMNGFQSMINDEVNKLK
jgi:protein-disulfide isomerase